MFRMIAFRSSYDGKPLARIEEVEPVKHNGALLWRDVNTGTVMPDHHGQGDVFDTRPEAVAAAVAALDRLENEFAELCRAEKAKVQS